MSVKRQYFLVRDLPLTECTPLSLADICGYCVGQYHVPTEIKNMAVFSL